MIYPNRRKKIRLFAGGGGMNALFDNPGTYLGIQYIPTAAETPDIEGLQYLMQMEEAKRKAQAEALEKNKPDLKAFNESLKGLQGLSGETQSFSREVENAIGHWQNKYNTPEKMASPEAATDMARIGRNIQYTTVALKNNQDTYNKQYTESEPVRSNSYFNNGHMILRDPKNPAQRIDVSAEEYYADREGKYKGLQPMTVGEVFNWKQRYSPFGMEDNFNVNQYNRKDTREYINNQFKSIGYNSSSFEGGEQLKGMLANAGIDPEKLDVGKFKYSLKSGEVNAQKLYQGMMDNFDSKAQNAIVSEMVEKGQNPFEMVTIGTDKKGKQITMPAMNAKIHEYLTGEIAKSLDSEHSVSIESREEANPTKRSGTEDVPDSTILANILNPQFSIDALANDLGYAETKVVQNVWSPFSEKGPVDAKALNYKPSDAEVEILLGTKPKFEEINNNHSVSFNGQKVPIGPSTDNGPTSRQVKFYETPWVGNVKVYEVPGEDGNPRKVSTIERTYMVADEESLKHFKREDGSPITPYGLRNHYTVPNIETLTSRELGARLEQYGHDPKIVEKRVGGHDTMWVWDNFPGDVFLVRVEEPLNYGSPFRDYKDAVARSASGEQKQRLNQYNKVPVANDQAVKSQQKSIYDYMNLNR